MPSRRSVTLYGPRKASPASSVSSTLPWISGLSGPSSPCRGVRMPLAQLAPGGGLCDGDFGARGWVIALSSSYIASGKFRIFEKKE
jgi:hypothetical protein